MRISQASAMTAPAPTATPWTAAITGLLTRRMFRMRAPVTRVNSSKPFMSRLNNSPIISSTSPPEQKALLRHESRWHGRRCGHRDRQKVSQFFVALKGERIETVRTIEGYGADVVRHGKIKMDRLHWGASSGKTTSVSISTRASVSTSPVTPTRAIAGYHRPICSFQSGPSSDRLLR